jgi:hypothetical protein
MKDTITITMQKMKIIANNFFKKKAHMHSKNYDMFTFSIEIPAIKLSLCCKGRINTNLKLKKAMAKQSNMAESIRSTWNWKKAMAKQTNM